MKIIVSWQLQLLWLFAGTELSAYSRNHASDMRIVLVAAAAVERSVINISITTVVSDDLSSVVMQVTSSAPRVAACRQLIALLLTLVPGAESDT